MARVTTQQAAARREKVAELWARGASVSGIAKTAGCDWETARRDLTLLGQQAEPGEDKEATARMPRTTQRATDPGRSRQLRAAQEAALDPLAVGKHDGEVAAAVSVSRQTVCGWRRYHPEFRARLNARRREVYGQAADRLRSLLDTALGVLEAELTTAGPAGAEARFRAAVKVLELGAGGLAPLVADPGPEHAWGVVEQEALRRDGIGGGDRMVAAGSDVEAVRKEWAGRLAAASAAADGA